jgi:dolichyl-phosphate-mannose-protein mannosyltransferase
MTRRLRLLHGVLTATAVLLAVHVLSILVTGGWAFRALGVRIGASRVLVPLMVLVAVALARRFVRYRAAAPPTFFAPPAAGTVFLACLLVYLANGKTLWSGDTLPARYLPLSILREGNFDLDEFTFLQDPTKFPNQWFIRYANGHVVSDYPVGAAVLAIPFYVPSALGRVAAESPVVEDLEKVAAATIVALSAMALYLTLRRLTTATDALLITAVYALGTTSLSESSQALWQHGASQLALAAALYCLVRGRREARWTALAGFPLAVAIVSRPSDVLLAVPIGLYVLFHRPRQLAGFLLSGLPAAAFQLWYNATTFGNPFRVQFFFSVTTAVRELPAGGGGWTTPMWDGLTGVLVSPSRGLLVYSPFVLFSLLGMAVVWRRGGDRLLRYLTPGVVLTVLLYSKWGIWWGGSSYGPRLLADLGPVLALLLYPITPLLARRPALRAVFVALVVWSIGAHAVGAFVDDRSWNWNGNVVVDRFPDRLWSWSDNQLVNPARDGLHRAIIALRRLPTSRSAPELLSASYRSPSPARLVVECGQTLQVTVGATNVGGAAWLAQSPRERGLVRLGWRWFKDGRPLPLGEGRVHLDAAVLPGQSHEFRASIVPPREPGAYVLEVGLLDERVLWFAERGTPPLRMSVTVGSAPVLPERGEELARVIEELRVRADHVPRVVVATDRPRYRQGDVQRLTLGGAVTGRSWVVDAYLLLRGPGERWFYDGHRVVSGRGCRWTPLARAIALPEGHRRRVHFDLPTADLPAGPYTWHLLLTEVDGYRIVSAAQTSFELLSAAEGARRAAVEPEVGHRDGELPGQPRVVGRADLGQRRAHGIEERVVQLATRRQVEQPPHGRDHL